MILFLQIIDVKKTIIATVEPKLLKWSWSLLILLLLVFYYFVVVLWVVNYLPTPLTNAERSIHPDRFIAENAARYLKGLTDLGPRVAGSTVNEVNAIEYLKRCLQEIKEQADLNEYIFEMDLQVASGSYALIRMINTYVNVQNLVVKLTPKAAVNSSDFLLINSHFDTVPSSPGGSDDGAMVAIMLEVLRLISRSPINLRNPIVFLFNGAEENPLQASHAFITQHKWAKNIRLVL